MARFYEGVDFEKLVKDYHSGDERVQSKTLDIACKSLKGFIINKMAKKYPTYVSREQQDLIQSGYTAVCEQFEKYDPQKGMPSTFFAPYIEHAMLECLIENVDGFSIYYHQILNKIKNVIKENPTFTDQQVSEITGVSVVTVGKTRQAAEASGKFSLDERFEDIPHKSLTPEEEYIEKERSEIVHEWLVNTLGATEREVIFDLFGLGGREPLSIPMLCRKMNVSQEDLLLTKESALKKLNTKEFFDAVSGDAVGESLFSIKASHTEVCYLPEPSKQSIRIYED